MTSYYSEPRERILTTASELFYRRGIHNVGVDEIVATSRVAKTTLYNHFSSKDQLIAEVMRRRSEQWSCWFFQALDKRGGSPKERLFAIFNVLEEWFTSHNFHGCPFSTTAAQLGDAQHPAYKFCLEPKHTIHAHIVKLAKEAGISNPEIFSQYLILLIDGAISAVNLEGISAAVVAQFARQAAFVLFSAN